MAAIDKARAIVKVDEAKRSLVYEIKCARAAGVSVEELMSVLNLNNYSYYKLLEI